MAALRVKLSAWGLYLPILWLVGYYNKLCHVLANYCLPTQLGVGAAGGSDSALHNLQAHLHHEPDRVLLKLDLANAFHIIDLGLQNASFMCVRRSCSHSTLLNTDVVLQMARAISDGFLKKTAPLALKICSSAHVLVFKKAIPSYRCSIPLLFRRILRSSAPSFQHHGARVPWRY